MALTPFSPSQNIPSAFATACMLSRSEGELLERCRAVLVERFESDQIWFQLPRRPAMQRVGPADGFADAIEAARLGTGESEVVVWAEPAVTMELRGSAMSLALAM